MFLAFSLSSFLNWYRYEHFRGSSCTRMKSHVPILFHWLHQYMVLKGFTALEIANGALLGTRTVSTASSPSFSPRPTVALFNMQVSLVLDAPELRSKAWEVAVRHLTCKQRKMTTVFSHCTLLSGGLRLPHPYSEGRHENGCFLPSESARLKISANHRASTLTPCKEYSLT
jgi:hypothetical protein